MTDLHRALHALAGLLDRVREELDGATEDTIFDALPTVDRQLREAYERADAARRWATLHKAPVYAPYQPAVLVRALTAESAAAPVAASSDTPVELEGDINILFESLRLVGRNMRLTGAGSIYTSYFTDVETPYVAITFDGPGELKQPLEVGPGLTILLAEFNQRWMAGTGGGATQATSNGLRLYLEGDYPADRESALSEALAPLLKRATSHLQAWRGAIGHYEEGLAGKAETLALYKSLVEKARHNLALATDSSA